MVTFRKGDRVTVKAEVVSDAMDFDGIDKIKVRVEPYHDIFVLVSDLTMDQPDIRVGDYVDWEVGTSIYRGEVLAVSGEHLWVGRGDGVYATVWLKAAERVDPTPVEEAA